MNNKGFSLIELLGCLVLLSLILLIGVYCARGTLSTALSTLDDTSVNEIKTAANSYILENKIMWTNNGEEYTCLTIKDLIDAGYFEKQDLSSYEDSFIKVVRDPKAKTITSINLTETCD